MWRLDGHAHLGGHPPVVIAGVPRMELP